MNWDLRLGDCLDPTTGLASLPDESVDIVITDPPYAVSLDGVQHQGPHGTRKLDFFEGDADWPAMVRFVVAVAEQCIRVAKKPGSAYWWCGHREFGPLVDLYESKGWTTKFLVWAKTCPPPPPPGSGWPSGAELCVYAYQPGRTWNYDGKRMPPNNVIRADAFRHGMPGKVDHPTQKPEIIAETAIRASTKPGDLILDPFTGSGTTGVAAIRNGRRFLGWEKEPKYHAIAMKRLAAAREQLDMFGGAA